MSDQLRLLSHPEIVVGIAGPIGIDIDAISDEIGRALGLVGYRYRPVRVTELMMGYPVPEVTQSGPDYFSAMNFKMDYANKLCEIKKDPAFLMRLAISGIQKCRADLIDELKPDSNIVSDTAYIVRQLKRPEEVQLLRKVYGKQFVLV